MEAFLRSPVEDTKMKKYFSKYLLKTYVYRLITTNNNKCLAQCLALGSFTLQSGMLPIDISNQPVRLNSSVSGDSMNKLTAWD